MAKAYVLLNRPGELSGSGVAKAFRHGIVLSCVVPRVSCNAPRTIALYQQIAADIVVHLGTVLQHARCGQHYCYVAEYQDLHPERALLERTERILGNPIHAGYKRVKGLAASRSGRWKERGVRQEIGRKCFPIRRRARRPSQTFEMGSDQGSNRLSVSVFRGGRHIAAPSVVGKNTLQVSDGKGSIDA